jgi:hypothetical protein
MSGQQSFCMDYIGQAPTITATIPTMSEVFFKAWAINRKHMHTPPAITATIPTDEQTIHITVPT